MSSLFDTASGGPLWNCKPSLSEYLVFSFFLSLLSLELRTRVVCIETLCLLRFIHFIFRRSTLRPTQLDFASYLVIFCIDSKTICSFLASTTLIDLYPHLLRCHIISILILLNFLRDSVWYLVGNLVLWEKEKLHSILSWEQQEQV